MTPLHWIALALFMAAALPAVVSFMLYLGNGNDLLRERAARFYRWAVLVVLVTFNIAIFKHIILIIIHW